MSPAQRRFKVTKPGKPQGRVESARTPAPVKAKGGRKYKVVTPGRPKAVERPVQRTDAAKAGPGARRYRVVTPGKKIDKQPGDEPVKVPKAVVTKERITRSRLKPRAARKPAEPAPSEPKPVPLQRSKGPVREVRRRGAPGPVGIKAPVKTLAKKEADKKTPADLSAVDKKILTALDKGPTTFQTLTKRTSMKQGALLPGLKKLTDSGYVISKQIKGIKKYKLSNKGYDHLHPAKFPYTLFPSLGKGRRKGRKRRLVWGKKMSRRQRIRRLDLIIGTLLTALIILVAYQSYIYFGLTQSSEPTNGDADQNNGDIRNPVIVWVDQPEIFDEPFDSLVVNLLVFDPGESPSGIDGNKIKVQYGFGSSLDLSEPNLSNWTALAPFVNLPYVNVSLRRNWTPLNGYFIFVRCFAFDNNDNVAMETFKILIYL